MNGLLDILTAIAARTIAAADGRVSHESQRAVDALKEAMR